MMGVAVCALAEARPGAENHVTSGRYGDILKGWWAQYAVVRARLASEISASRSGTATGQALRELAESELWRLIPDEPTKAIGEVVLVRTVTVGGAGAYGLADRFAPGVIQGGFRFAKNLVTTELSPDQEPAECIATSSVYADRDSDEATPIGGGQYTHTQRITIPIEATREGTHANVPFVPADPQNGLGVALDAPFDPTFTVESLRAAGGTVSRSDLQLRAIARHALLGNKGPNSSSLIVGSLLYPGAHRAVHLLDTAGAVAALFVTDESWGYSEAFAGRIERELMDGDWIGFGAKVEVRGIQVVAITFDVTATLREPMDLVASEEIEVAIAAALADYFIGEHWYIWTSAGLRGIVASSDRRLQSVESVIVRHDGVILAEPALDPTASSLIHWHVRKNGVTVTLAT